MPDSKQPDSVSSEKTPSAQRWNLRRLTMLATGGLFLLFVLAFVHPFGNARVADANRQLMTSAQTDKAVLDLMQRACQNCHSEQTTWPVYSHFAPVSWLIEKDVIDGRNHWNMSRWDQYTVEEREDVLSRIGPMVRNRKMPLPKYLFLHPEAKLTDAETESIYRWARQERKRLRSENQSAADPTK